MSSFIRSIFLELDLSFIKGFEINRVHFKFRIKIRLERTLLHFFFLKYHLLFFQIAIKHFLFFIQSLAQGILVHFIRS